MPRRAGLALALLGLTGVTLVALPSVAAATSPPSRACDVRLDVHDDVVRAVARSRPGQTVCLDAGHYRLARPIRPKRGQELRATAGPVVLDGSRLLRGFARQHDGWVVRHQTQQGERNGECVHGTACTYPDDVLRDGVPMRRVLHRADLGPGRYWFDYPHDTIHVGSDPHGHRTEALVATAAVVSRPGGSDVTIDHLTAEHFATRAQHGAIETSAPGWTIRAVDAIGNHGAGFTTGGHVRLLHDTAADNGQLGIGGTGDDTLVAGNLIERNGGGGFDPGWEAGGAKWALTDHLVVRHNEVYDNAGPGLWTDIDAQHTTYVGNDVRGNSRMGIFHEISATATIARNDVRDNGHGFDAWLWGGGIVLAGSHDVTVRDNRLSGNAEGIALIQQDRGVSSVDGLPRRLHDVDIRDNVVRMDRGDSGLVEDDGDTGVFDDDTITWTGDTWTHRGPTPFLFDDGELSLAQWKALGHDG